MTGTILVNVKRALLLKYLRICHRATYCSPFLWAFDLSLISVLPVAGKVYRHVSLYEADHKEAWQTPYSCAVLFVVAIRCNQPHSSTEIACIYTGLESGVPTFLSLQPGQSRNLQRSTSPSISISIQVFCCVLSPVRRVWRVVIVKQAFSMDVPGQQAPTPPPDDSKARTLLAIYWTQFAIALLSVSGRMYARLLIRAIGWDDVCILFSMACYTGPLTTRYLALTEAARLSTLLVQLYKQG